jgi:methionyl-tRNA formyltransferase
MNRPSRIAVLCATRRGLLFLEELMKLSPESELTVFSFKEEPWEPPFLDAIKCLVESRQHRFIQAKIVGGDEHEKIWEKTEFDLMFVVGWRYLVPENVFKLPSRGTFVFHDSLLPEYRGFSPTVWAIANGEDHTGVTLFEMDAGMDTGCVVAQERVPFGEAETIAIVMERVTETYLSLLKKNLHNLLAGMAPRVAQDENHATYCCKRLPEDNRIDWSRSAREVHNLIRAVTTPYPGAYTMANGQRVRVWSAMLPTHPRRYVYTVPGRVVEVLPGLGTVVLTGDGCIVLEKIQMEGGEVTNAANVLKHLSLTLR